jgi:membrane protein
MPPSSPHTPSTPSPRENSRGRASWRLARGLARRIHTDDLFGRSSQLAFDFLLAIFPLMLFMLTVLGLFASHSLRLQGSLMAHVSHFLPRSAFRLLNRVTREIAQNAGGAKLAFGIVVGLWLATSGVVAMISGLNLAYRVRETRSWLKVRAIALALTLSLSLLVLFVLTVVLLGGDFARWAGSAFGLEPFVVDLWVWIEWPIAVLFVTMSFSLIYCYGPDLPRHRWRRLLPGSVVAALIWLVVSLGFRFYLRFFNAYSATYGSLGAVMILLIWLYASGLAFLIGGELNAEIESSAPDRQRS